MISAIRFKVFTTATSNKRILRNELIKVVSSRSLGLVRSYLTCPVIDVVRWFFGWTGSSR